MNVVLVHHGYGTPSHLGLPLMLFSHHEYGHPDGSDDHGPGGGGRVHGDLGKLLTEVC